MILRTKYGEADIDIRVGRYGNGSTAILLSQEGEPWGQLTFQHTLLAGEIAVKTWSENSDWYEQLLDHPAFERTDRLISLNLDAIGEIWKFDRSKL